MKKQNTRILILLSFIITGIPGLAQEQKSSAEEAHGIEYGGGVRLYEPYTLQTRTQYRDLGIGPYDVIPSGQSAITSLAVSPEGNIYGGCTGEAANLFVFFPGYNFVFPLGTIPGHESINQSLVFDSKGYLLIGTTLDMRKEYPVDKDISTGNNSAYKSVTIQIKREFQQYEGGHIYRYDPFSDNTGFHQRLFRINKPCPLQDLGIPIPHEGILTLIKDHNSDQLYGLSFPGAWLFRFDPGSGETSIITQTNSQIPLGSELPHMSKCLIQDHQGNIYCNTYGGYLLKYSPGKDDLDTLRVRLPGIKGRWVFNAMECALLHPDGRIYGGTTDGYLFCFDPESEKMMNYGKPLIETKIRTMTLGKDGNIYGIGGEDRTGMSRLFQFDTRTHTFNDLGIVQVSHVPYQETTGLIFDAMVTGKDGSIYLGQSEYRSKLFIYIPY